MCLTQTDQTPYCYAIYYNTLCRSVLDYGKEIDAFHGSFRYFSSTDTVLDYFFMAGGGGDKCVANVLECYAEVIGAPALPPRWSFGYLASSMGYAEDPDAQKLLERHISLHLYLGFRRNVRHAKYHAICYTCLLVILSMS